MRNLFLSYHYDDLNRKLARQVEDLLESHNLRALTGDVLGGGSLTPELQREIADADGFVALLTRGQQLTNGSWITHPFCLTELQYANTIKKPTIALVEEGVQPPSGLYQEHERIDYNPDNPLSAFLRLSRTIWKWKSKLGRTVKIQLIPPTIAQEIWANQGACQWQYRLSSGDKDTEWMPAKAKKEPGGLFVYVQVPDDTMLIEIRIQCANKLWSSEATPFYMPIMLAEYGNTQSQGNV